MGRSRRLPAEPFCIDLTAFSASGRAVGEHHGEPLEVHDALPGERVSAQYLFGRRFRGQARALEVLQAAPGRVTPRCPHFGTCSACTLQHASTETQVAFKQDVLLQTFESRAGLRPGRLLPAIQADRWHYRRKARLSVRKVRGKGRVLVGFRERDGRFVADMAACPVLPQSIESQLPALAELVGSLDADDTIPQIEVTCGDVDCALTFRHLEPLTEGDRDRLSRFARDTGLRVYLQGSGPASVVPVAGDAQTLSYRLPEFGLEYRFQPQDFVQVNASVNQAMVAQALALLALTASDRVLELFCGLGNFSLPMAGCCASVTAFEGDEGLVARAQANATLNGIENVRFAQADLYEERAMAALALADFNKALIDPPRSGAGPVLAGLAASGIERLVYVSCNPVTLAEDCGRLVGTHGFRLAAAGVMDMFPHTAHMESMALLERQ